MRIKSRGRGRGREELGSYRIEDHETESVIERDRNRACSGTKERSGVRWRENRRRKNKV